MGGAAEPGHILVVTEAFPNPSETFIVHQVNGLIEAGYSVTLLSLPGLVGAPVHQLVHRHDLLDRVRYRGRGRLPALLPAVARRWGWRTALACADPLAHGRLALSGRLAAAALALDPADGPFQAILAHFGPNGELAARLRRIGVLRGPLLTFFHGVDVGTRSPQALRRKYRAVFADGEALLAASSHFRDRLAGIPSLLPRLDVHRMGIEMPPAPERTTPAADEPRHLVSIGRLVEKKGLDTALEALALVRDRSPISWTYAIIGDGVQGPALRDQARRLGLEDRVRFLGWRDQEAVAAELARALVVLAPSRTPASGDTEACPLSISEAMAHGCAVCATHHGGIPEMVRHGHTGLLSPEGDAPALADHLLGLLQDPARAVTMGRAGRAWITEQWDVATWNRRLIDRIQSLPET